MRRLHLPVIAAIALLPAAAAAQDDARAERVMARVRSALAPALSSFPATDASGSVPADGKPTALWMVRPHQAGDRTIEILANPLNEDYQRRAAKAMAQIESSIEAAQRRAEQQYERAIAEAKRTRRSQEVDGVSLADEGVAGARIDADSHVTIDVLFNQPSYRFEIASGVEPDSAYVPRVAAIAGATVLSVPANVYRGSKTDGEQFCESQILIYLGRIDKPTVDRRDAGFEVTALGTPSESGTAISSIVIRLRGNEPLMADLLRTGNWSSVLELIQ